MGLEKPADSCCTPLCTWCHRTGLIAQHRANETAWWEALGIDPLEFAGQIHSLWEADIPNIARPQIIELIDATHEIIREHVNQVYCEASRQFDADPTPDFAPILMDAYMRKIVARGIGDQFKCHVDSLQRYIDDMLMEATI